MIAERAESLYRGVSPYPGPALDHHNLRLAAFTVALGERHGVDVEPNLTAAIAWVHDIGLLVKDPAEGAYTRRGLRFLEPHLDAWELDAERREIVAHTMLFNHSLRPLRGVHPAAELFRRAVQVEHSFGALRHGLERDVVRSIFARWPRRGLNAVLLDFARITLLHDGPGVLLPIFLPAAPARLHASPPPSPRPCSPTAPPRATPGTSSAWASGPSSPG